MDDFKPGDIVVLKSGSPRYVVIRGAAPPSNQVLVMYSVYETREIKTHEIPIIALKKTNSA